MAGVQRLFLFLAVVSQALTMVVTSDEFLEEPRCLSMYDFGYKLIRKVVDLEKAQGDMARLVEEQQATIEGLKQQLSRVAEQIKTWSDVVLVHAKSPAKLTVSVGEKIVFGEVDVNVRSAYSQHTGSFRAPLPGLYWISSELCTEGTAWIGFGIKKDGTLLAASLSGDPSYTNCATASVVTLLEAGSEVWVEMLSGTGKPLHAPPYGNYFSVVRLQPVGGV